MLYQCLNSCELFAEKKCPHQQLLEKLCLIPQLSTVEEIEKICKSQCCTNEVLCSDHPEKVLESLQQSER